MVSAAPQTPAGRFPMNRALPFLSFSLVLLLGLPVGADRLVTHDGRILEVKKARQLPDGSYQLTFKNGEIHCPERFIASVEIEGDMSDYVPKNADEKAKLEKGFVRYGGKWMSKPAYEAELKRQAKASRERTEELTAHADFYDGWEKTTKHFVIKTNTSPELLDYYAELLEAYYKLMDKRVGINPAPTLRRTKMKVNIYKNRAEFTRMSGLPPGVAGYFSFTEESLNFFHNYPEPEISDWVGLHECTHLLTYLIQPQAAPSLSAIWMNEGMADYFGSAEITRDKKGKLQIEPGRIQVDRILTVQQAIKEETFVPLKKLFGLKQSGFHAFEYAEWLEYIAGLEINAPQARLKRGLNAVLSGNEDEMDQAAEDLDAAIEAGIENPRAYWARGVLKTHRAKSGLQTGIDDFRKAVELAPLDPLFRFNLGQVLAGYELSAGPIRIKISGEYELYGDKEELQEASLHYGLASELDPENDDYRQSFQEFLAAYQRQGDKKAGADEGSGQ